MYWLYRLSTNLTNTLSAAIPNRAAVNAINPSALTEHSGLIEHDRAIMAVKFSPCNNIVTPPTAMPPAASATSLPILRSSIFIYYIFNDQTKKVHFSYLAYKLLSFYFLLPAFKFNLTTSSILSSMDLTSILFVLNLNLTASCKHAFNGNPHKLNKAIYNRILCGSAILALCVCIPYFVNYLL